MRGPQPAIRCGSEAYLDVPALALGAAVAGLLVSPARLVEQMHSVEEASERLIDFQGRKMAEEPCWIYDLYGVGIGPRVWPPYRQPTSRA